MYSYVDLTAMVLNCRLTTTRHINYIGLSWRGSLIMLLRLQLMLCLTHISCEKNETGKNRKFCENPTETEPEME